MNGSALTFDPAISVWLIVLLWLAGMGLSGYQYYQERKLGSWQKAGLGVLRFLAVSLMALLLANPSYQFETFSTQTPHWLMMLDHSESVQFEHGAYSGPQQYQEIADHIVAIKPANVSLSYMAWGDSSRSLSNPVIQATDPATNLSEAFAYVNQQMEQSYDGIILFSDGIYNRGADPTYSLNNFQSPVYTIGLGDTTMVRDIRIQNVTTDPIGYTNTDHTISISVAQTGYKNKSIELRLLSEESGTELGRQSISFPTNNSSHTVDMTVPLDKPGFKSYSIELTTAENEWNERNNRRTTVLQVKESKQRILHLAFDIHPDVKTIRSILKQSAQLKVYTRTWMGGSSFAEGNLNISADSLEALIIHGWPRTLPTEIQDAVTTWAGTLPVMFLLSPQTSPAAMRAINDETPLNFRRSLQPLPISLSKDTLSTHTIVEGIEYPQQVPVPLMGTIRNISMDPGARAILWPSYNDLSYLDAPILAVKEWGNRRAISVNAFNWYRWMQVGNQPAAFVRTLFQNATDWLLTDPADDQLTVTPVNPVVQEGDEVQFNGMVKNERGQPERNATIALNIKQNAAEDPERSYTMRHDRDGSYSLNAGRWSPGTYQYEARASVDGQLQASVQGGFRVIRAQLEDQRIMRNDRLLSRIAALSGGKYYPIQSDSLDHLWDQIAQQHSFASTKTSELHSFALRTHWIWFALLVLLLGTEWLLRKRSGLV